MSNVLQIVSIHPGINNIKFPENNLNLEKMETIQVPLSYLAKHCSSCRNFGQN